jgi:hypothetical protein
LLRFNCTYNYKYTTTLHDMYNYTKDRQVDSKTDRYIDRQVDKSEREHGPFGPAVASLCHL